MKIAAAAYPIDWHNRWNEYVGKLRVWVRTAAENGATLLVFPEYAALELASLAREENAKNIQKVIEAITARIKDVDELHSSLAREFSVHICAGTALLRVEDGALVNRARLFAPDGTFGAQDKQSPTSTERDSGIRPGRVARIFDTSLGRIGILPGRDGATFPLARAMVEGGADILLIPNCAPSIQVYWRARITAMARAVENQCVVVQAVTLGEASWLATAVKNVGAAGIFTSPDDGLPDDGVIAAGKMNATGWIYGEVDLDLVRAGRTRRDPILREALGAPSAPVERVALGKSDSKGDAEPALSEK